MQPLQFLVVRRTLIAACCQRPFCLADWAAGKTIKVVGKKTFFRRVKSNTLQNIQVSQTPLHTQRTTNLFSNLGLNVDQVEQNSLIH